ncbi:MAG: SPOR domain-containing protein [Mangrovicoccus sp.]|nr:SPOR domain-containing protein [Mangrovicoccus sp.]
MILRLAAAGLVLTIAFRSAVAEPAEPPPEGFAGATWVDSRGCAFQRAEIGGAVVWADRLTAAGAPVCGLPPGLADLGPSDAVPAIPPNRRGSPPEFPEPGVYAQIAAFSGKVKADRLVTALQTAGIPALRQDFPRGGGVLRVIYAGPLGSESEAAARIGQIRAMGYADAFVWTQD